jgi:hypothetical protein
VSKNYVIKDTATRNFEPFSQISRGLFEQIAAHQWRARHYSASPREKRDTYQDVREGGRVLTAKYVRGLLAGMRHVRRIRWVTGEPGILFDGGIHGYWLLIQVGYHPKPETQSPEDRAWFAQRARRIKAQEEAHHGQK